MRKILWVLMLLLLAGNGWARDIDRFTSGTWWNASQSGHGFSVEVLPDNLTVIYWYVYHPDGTPTFLIAVDANTTGNVVQATAYYNTGMKFGAFDIADKLPEEVWGTLKLTLNSCNTATLEYNSQLVHNGVPYGSGVIQLTKAASIDGMQCADNPNAGIYVGTFNSAVTGELVAGQAVLSPDGGFAVFSQYVIANNWAVAGTGNWAATGTTFLGSGEVVSANPNNIWGSSDITMTGQIMPDNKMAGTYKLSQSGTEWDSGSFDLYAVPSVYRRGITLQEISGKYGLTDLFWDSPGAASLSTNGSLTGSFFGFFGGECLYSGQLTLPAPKFNLIKVSYSLSDCGILDGQYTGYGAQTDVHNLGDRRGLRLVTTNGLWAGALDLHLGCELDSYEPDDASATPISSGVRQIHSICAAGDLDWVEIVLTDESEVVIETSGYLLYDDTVLTLTDTSSVPIDDDDDSGTDFFSKIDRICGVDALPAGQYFARVNAFNAADTIIRYNITVTVTPCVVP